VSAATKIRQLYVPSPPPDLRRSGRSRRGHPCPICARDDGQCIALPSELDPQHWLDVWCIRGADQPGGRHAQWGFREQGIWYFRLDATTLAPRQAVRTAQREVPVADPETLHAVLALVARFFGLSDADRDRLAARGYDRWSVGPDGRHMFATLPADRRARVAVAAHILAQHPEITLDDLVGTYGFVRDGRFDQAAILFLRQVDGAALIEFARDETRRIIGYQYSPDTPKLDNKGKPLKRLTPSRFLTSGRYHVAYGKETSSDEIWHCEGIHKANLVADCKESIALAAFGSGGTAGQLAGAKAVDPHRQRLHVVALDRDCWQAEATIETPKPRPTAETQLAHALVETGYRVALARWDGPHKGPDDALAASAEITLQPFTGGQPTPPRDRRLEHAYTWQRQDETPEQRAALLAAAAQHVADGVRQFIDANDRTRLQVQSSGPGIGKSTAVAALGKRTGTRRRRGEYDLGWIGQRKDMAADLGLAKLGYTVIEACGPANCPEHELHTAIAESGRVAWPIHQQHAGGLCPYAKQFSRPGSAFYTQNHVPTKHLAGHQAIPMDEMDLPAWLPEKPYSVAKLRRTAATFSTQSTANRLLGALQAIIAEAYGTNTRLQGRALFEALDKRCGGGGQLAAWLAALQHDPRATNLHPPTELSIHDPLALEKARAQPPIVLPFVWHGLYAELLKWQRGGEWNSRLRIGPFRQEEWALHITTPLQFGQRDGEPLPPRVLLDATANAEILSRLFGCQVDIQREDVAPPPHTRHVAVRTGKRYGKVSMTPPRSGDGDPERTSWRRYDARVAAEIRYLLRELDPKGEELAAGRVGLITHKGCEQPLAEAIGIPYHDPALPEGTGRVGRTGHFWGIRGSNRLEDCTILLVVGTPALQPDDVLRMARALYADDPVPLDEACDANSGDWRYRDSRLQRVADALSHAELTQCAHRNRPLRHDGRVVVTLCAGDVDFLPVTTEITSLPHLTSEGELRATVGRAKQSARLVAALTALRERGELVTVRALVAEAKVDRTVATAWLKGQKEAEPGISEAFLEMHLDPYSISKNKMKIHSPPPAPPSGVRPRRRLTRTDVELRAGEQDPATYAARLSTKFGVPEAEARRLHAQVWRAGAFVTQWNREVREYLADAAESPPDALDELANVWPIEDVDEEAR
jgi:hypothetical protein